jgi:hypothetical protein
MFSRACGVCFNKTRKKRKRLGFIPNDGRVLDDCFDDSQNIGEAGLESPIRVIKRARTSFKAKAEVFAFKNVRIPERPDESCMRVWTDSSSKFTVSAEFIEFQQSGKVALHKANGVRIAIPLDKLSPEDMAYVANLTERSLDELQSEAARNKTVRSKIAPKNTRKWTDSTSYFEVEAQYLAFQDGKVHLHKANGIKIAVPIEKLSSQDLEYINIKIDLQGQDLETTEAPATNPEGTTIMEVDTEVEDGSSSDGSGTRNDKERGAEIRPETEEESRINADSIEIEFLDADSV